MCIVVCAQARNVTERRTASTLVDTIIQLNNDESLVGEAEIDSAHDSLTLHSPEVCMT